MGRKWEVVGGGDKGGVLVRQGQELNSPQCRDRLSTGAFVEEKELVGDRLHYKRLTGAGPDEGWVSVRLNTKDLLLPVAEPDDAGGAPAGSEAQEAERELSPEETLRELLRVEGGAPPSTWLPWVPQVRGRAVGQPQVHTDCLLWLAKKAQLGQDAFLLGPPGCDCRLLALQFCALVGKEAMYLRLSRDTTESDLKQRREIQGGSVIFSNQPPVDAALHGRVLILEGIEKAERNVLPLLNNLLENREMQLEDGSFLLAPHKRHLLEGDGEGAPGSDSAVLRPVHPSFFVIAIGLPVPRYRGMPLDPPLRSRFAAFNVEPATVEEERAQIRRVAPSLPPSEVASLVNAANRVRKGPPNVADTGLYLPRLSEESLRSAAKLRHMFPGLNLGEALRHSYPHHILRMDEGRRKTLSAALGSELCGDSAPSSPGYRGVSVREMVAAGPAYVEDGRFREWERPPRSFAQLHFEPGTPAGAGKSRSAGATKGVVAHCGDAARAGSSNAFEGLVASQRDALVSMMQDHAVGADICLVGERGVGKTLLTRRFAALLGYRRFTTFCFQDMTARELTARRSTNESGDTTWQWSPLVEAAVNGELAILDGVHRLPVGTLAATVGRLVSDRELDLPDGTRLVCWDHWQALRLHYSVEELQERKVGLVHPSFRIICTAEPPTLGRNWLDEELLTLFHFVSAPPPSDAEYAELLTRASKSPPTEKHISGLHSLASKLRGQAEEEPHLYQPITFSTRRILQVGQYKSSQGNLGEAVAMALSAPIRFLPQNAQDVVRGLFAAAETQGLPRVPIAGAAAPDAKAAAPKELPAGERLMALELEAIALHLQVPADHAAMMTGRDMPWDRDMDPSAMVKRVEETKAKLKKDEEAARIKHRDELQRAAAAAVEPAKGREVRSALQIQNVGTEVRIGSVRAEKSTPERPELVPHDRFVDIPKHVEVLQRLLLDYSLGNHMLLIGNQGVGKNKIADRLLALLGKEREYVQLHRDTTISSLVMTPTLTGGAVVWEDSPLVRAVRHGRVLMVDEADKAPLEVVCVLKSLVEDRELALPNGRRIAHRASPGIRASDDDKVIWMHDGFRVVVLANRPGFPFLGNDFYRECGDVFASVVVDNPDMRSEAELLRSYGETVPKGQIAKILALFATLREQVDTGKISYPYSAREAVKIVEHLERFPEDSLERACRDVFAFDVQNPTALQVLTDMAWQHGIRVVAGVRDGASEEDIYHVMEKKPPPKADTKGGPRGGMGGSFYQPEDETVKLAKDPDFDWRPKEKMEGGISQAEVDRAIKMMEDYDGPMPDRRRGLSPVRGGGQHPPMDTQAKGWGLRMNGGQGKGSFGFGIAKPTMGASGFGIALGGPVENAPRAATLPPDLSGIKFPDKINFRKELLEHVRKEVDLASKEGRFKNMHLGGDQSMAGDESAAKAGGRGKGEGKGEGQGSGEGSGKGSGKGDGKGEGEGSGKGDGKGEGEGSGSGRGKGAGRGEGAGKGKGEGKGKGKGGNGENPDDGWEFPPEKGLSKNDAQTYEGILEKIAGPLQQMRRLIEGHVAKEKEREWQTFRTDGELDDGLVVDGVCGQQNIYRRRHASAEPMFVVKKPKRLRFAVDLSKSMIVYNRLDKRLERLCEAAVFMFEAFAGHEEKYDYSFVGYSGAGPTAVPLVEWGRPPVTRRERLDVLGKMWHHASTVETGDSTLEATRTAVRDVMKEPADEHFAFVVSDAELDRYGITPEIWNEVLMNTDRRCQAYTILISMETEKVASYRNGIAPAHGFLCESNDDLIAIFRKIFDTALFKR